MDKFFGGGDKKSEKKKRNTNTGSVKGSEGVIKEETMSNAEAEAVPAE